MKALIAGVDPGITTGVAILDSNGKLISIWSKRDAKSSDIIKHIMKFGKPVIIATDVSRVPKSVKNIARKFNCTIYSPEQTLSVAEKNRLAKLYAVKTEDRHELDALAAAIRAFHIHQEFFNRVESALKKRKLKKRERLKLFKNVIELLLSDESENITNAINRLQKGGAK